jgi:antitoxin CptB
MSHQHATSDCDHLDDLELRRRRLLFRCWHRGTQEIDLILGSFATSSLSGFQEAQIERFEGLLDCTDLDLFDWITASATPPAAYNHDVMRQLRCFRYDQRRAQP